MNYSKSRDFNKLIQQVLNTPAWCYVHKGHRKHANLIHQVTGTKVPVPFSPACTKRGLLNFKTQLKRLDPNLKQLF